jgi:hypothetical protein
MNPFETCTISSAPEQDTGRNDNNNRSTSSSQQQSSQGIDIRQALDILSSRTPHDHHDHHHGHSLGGGRGGCSCQHEGRELPDDVKQAATSGQVIDLFAAPTTTTAVEEGEQQQQQQQQQLQMIEETKQQQKLKSEQNKKELVEKLRTVSKLSDILRLILKTQEDRVTTYKQYNNVLQQVLKTNNLTLYPTGCANATASFTVLSDTIISVKDELIRRRGEKSSQEPQQNEQQQRYTQYTEWIQNLQSLEKEKLQLTAAMHLEKIRVSNQQQQKGNDDKEGGGDARVLNLLERGVTILQQKIDECVANINLVLDDLRCALVEEMEEEEGQ